MELAENLVVRKQKLKAAALKVWRNSSKSYTAEKSRARLLTGVPGVFHGEYLNGQGVNFDEPILDAYRAAPHVKLTPVVKRTLFLFTFSPVMKLIGRVKK